ncbi:MAG: hypothetical protein ACK4M3_00210 [Pyrobaculum sp.]
MRFPVRLINVAVDVVGTVVVSLNVATLISMFAMVAALYGVPIPYVVKPFCPPNSLLGGLVLVLIAAPLSIVLIRSLERRYNVSRTKIYAYGAVVIIVIGMVACGLCTLYCGGFGTMLACIPPVCICKP